MNDSARGISGSTSLRSTEPEEVSALPGNDPGRSPALQMLEHSILESLIDDATQVIQRTPFICRYPKRLWTVGLVSEFADAVDRLNVKLSELQGADR